MDPVTIVGYAFMGAIAFSALFAYFYWVVTQSPDEGYASVPTEVVAE